MSILWRAGISTHPFFSKVSLGPHEESLRDRLFNEAPGVSTDYSCVVALLTDEGKPFPLIITEPVVRRVDGRHLYVFVFGSMFWVFSVSCSSHPLPPELREYVLKEDGSLKLLSGDIHQSRYFQRFFQGICDAQPGWREP